MTAKVRLLLVVGGLALAGLWLWQYTNHVRALANLTTSRDSLNIALRTAQDSSKARERVQIALQGQIDSLRSIRSRVLVRVDTLQVRVVAQESVFVGHLPDSLKAAFRDVVSVNDSIIKDLRGVILGDSLALGKKDQQLDLRDASLADCRAGLKAALDQRDKAMRLAQPPFFTRVVKSLPAVGLGALGVLILRR